MEFFNIAQLNNFCYENSEKNLKYLLDGQAVFGASINRSENMRRPA